MSHRSFPDGAELVFTAIFGAIHDIRHGFGHSTALRVGECADLR